MPRKPAVFTGAVCALVLALGSASGCGAPRADAADDGAAAAAAGPTSAATPAEARLRHRTTDFGGVALHYDDVGTGTRALVFVHGWAGDRSVWRLQVPALADVGRCLALDLPGHGESLAPQLVEDDYTIDLFADAVVAVMDDAGVEQAVLVGHGNGVPVVRHVLRRRPERVAALVLVEGSLRPVFADRAQAEPIVAQYRQPAYREVARQLIVSMLSPDLPTDLKSDLVQRMLRTPQAVMVGAFEATLDPALWAPDPIGVPLLVVLAKSPFWDEDDERFVLSLAPAADYVVLEDVSHFLVIDAPERFAALLRDFVWAWDLLR